MKTEAQMRSYVMRRVYTMYYARMLAAPLPRLTALALLALGLVSSVSVTSVVANALNTSGVEGFALFALAAFVGTSPLVQAVVVGIVAMMTWFTVDSVKDAGTVFTGDEVPAQ